MSWTPFQILLWHEVRIQEISKRFRMIDLKKIQAKIQTSHDFLRRLMVALFKAVTIAAKPCMLLCAYKY